MMARIRPLRIHKDWTRWFLSLFSLYAVWLSAAIAEFARTPEAVLVLVVCTMVFLVKSKGLNWLKDKVGLWLVLLSLFIEGYHYISTGVFTIGSVKFFALIVTIYHVVNQYGRVATDILFGIIYKLTIITVPFFVFQMVDHGLLLNLLSLFDMSQHGSTANNGTYVFFFNLCSWQPTRNSGFMWEAGAFGAMLIFLIVYRYVFVHGMKVKKDTIWLYLYSMTTLSTTTFFVLGLCLFFLLFQRYKKNILKFGLYTSMFLIVAIPVYNLSFMKGKIDKYMNDNVDYNRIYSNQQYAQTHRSASIGRFAGFLIEFDRVKSRPVLGYGWDDDYSAVGIGNEWSNPSGLAILLGKFGFLGAGLVCFGLFNFLPIGNGSSRSERIMVGLILILPLFSNPFHYNVIVWIMIMMGWINFVRKRPFLILGNRNAVSNAHGGVITGDDPIKTAKEISS